MIIRESIEINAPALTVWRVFSAFEEWGRWNDVCENCCVLEGDAMAAGTCFSFTLRPYRIPLTIAPKIIRCDPLREVVWAGSRLGVHAEHRFLFEPFENGIRLTSVESFSGLMFQVSRLIGVPRKLHRLTRRLLSAIKHQAESCSSPVRSASPVRKISDE